MIERKIELKLPFETSVFEEGSKRIRVKALILDKIINHGNRKVKFTKDSINFRKKTDGTINCPMFKDHKTDVDNAIGHWDKYELINNELIVEGYVTSDEYYEKMRNGTLTSFSVGVSVDKGDIENKDGVSLVKRCKLKEISVVGIPAEENASLLALNDNDVDIELHEIQTITDCSKFLKNLGLSNSQEKEFIFKLKEIIRNESSGKEDTRNELETQLQEANNKIADLKATIDILNFTIGFKNGRS